MYLDSENRVPVPVKVKRLHENSRLPTYAEPGAAGMDLYAYIDFGSFFLYPGERVMVETGISLEVPRGFEGQIRPRSGLAAKQGITVLNTPGTIDSSYRGQIKVVLINTSGERFKITDGDRIAQLVIAPVTRAELIEVTELSETERGTGGFGSTGEK